MRVESPNKLKTAHSQLEVSLVIVIRALGGLDSSALNVAVSHCKTEGDTTYVISCHLFPL
jgi:hypothetical protein